MPSERSLLASVASHTSWASTPDRAARTAPARAALLARFEREADPDGTLDPTERTRRAEHLRSAHYSRLALRAVRARRRSAELAAEADAATAALAADGFEADGTARP